MKNTKIWIGFATFVIACLLFSTPPQQKIVQRPTVPQRIEIPPSPPKPYTIKDATASILAENLKAHVYYLASEKLQGRMTGEPGCNLAANYIKNVLTKNNLP